MAGSPTRSNAVGVRRTSVTSTLDPPTSTTATHGVVAEALLGREARHRGDGCRHEGGGGPELLGGGVGDQLLGADAGQQRDT